VQACNGVVTWHDNIQSCASQAGPSTAAGPSGFGYSSTPQPGSGGPPVPGAAGTPVGLGALGGAVQAGLNPAQPYIRGLHSAAATGLGLGGRGRHD
jgi:hypothetical protein